MTTKRDRLETEHMLERLADVLDKHYAASDANPRRATIRNDAEALRRISMTLHRWHELECGNGDDRVSWHITRGNQHSPEVNAGFSHDENGAPFIERHFHDGSATSYTRLPDREAGALKRLNAIMARYPALQAYVQGDPRGAALYIIRPGDVPEGATVDSCYSRGIAVYR